MENGVAKNGLTSKRNRRPQITKEELFRNRWTYERTKPTGQIYFVMNPNDGCIKIGYTGRTVWERMRNLKTGNTAPLFLLGVIRGTLEDEMMIHELFADCRVPGLEWFRSTRELHAFMILYLDRFGISFDDNLDDPIQGDRMQDRRESVAARIMDESNPMPDYPLPDGHYNRVMDSIRESA